MEGETVEFADNNWILIYFNTVEVICVIKRIYRLFLQKFLHQFSTIVEIKNSFLFNKKKKIILRNFRKMIFYFKNQNISIPCS